MLTIVMAGKCVGSVWCVLLIELGDVYSFGDGSNGQLGCGNKCLEGYSPQLLSWLNPMKIMHASCGEGHTALISGEVIDSTIKLGSSDNLCTYLLIINILFEESWYHCL